MIFALLVGIIGIALAYVLYGKGPSKTVDRLVDGPLHGAYEASKAKLWFDEIYDVIIVRPFKTVARGLFDIDEADLAQITHPDYPGERLVACRNPELRRLRAHKRQALLDGTAKELEHIRSMVQQGRLKGRDRIGVRVGRVVNKHKVAKHFGLDIREDGFDFHIDQEQVAAEAGLDGIYVLRTSVSPERLATEDVVRQYKRLTDVERAFRSLKGIDLRVRPIHHHLEERVRAHIFLCMLAYYVEWHLREAWRPLLFADEDQEAKQGRDPVGPAKRSKAALRKARFHTLEDGSEVHSFRTLLKQLSTIVRNVCRAPGSSASAPTFEVVTTPNATQQRAYDLLQTMSV